MITLTLTRTAETTWRGVTDFGAKQLRTCGEVVEREHAQALAGIRTHLADSVCVGARSAENYLTAASARIDGMLAADQRRLRRQVPQLARPWAGLLSPFDAQRHVKHALEAKDWRTLARQLLDDFPRTPTGTSRCFDLVLAVQGSEPLVLKYLDSVVSDRRTAITEAGISHQSAIGKISSTRVQVVSRLRNQWNVIRQDVETAIAPFVSALKAAEETYRSELRKAGVKV